jgi:hypothetical protein
MATNMRGASVVGYNVQAAVDTEHHLIVTHEVTNVVVDRTLLAPMAAKAKDVLRCRRSMPLPIADTTRRATVRVRGNRCEAVRAETANIECQGSRTVRQGRLRLY